MKKIIGLVVVSNVIMFFAAGLAFKYGFIGNVFADPEPDIVTLSETIDLPPIDTFQIIGQYGQIETNPKTRVTTFQQMEVRVLIGAQEETIFLDKEDLVSIPINADFTNLPTILNNKIDGNGKILSFDF